MKILTGKRIAIDQDYVLAKLTDKWVRTYNAIFGDNLKVEDIQTWNIADYVKEEAKPYMKNILNIHKFYRDLGVVDNAPEVITWLHEQGAELFIATDPFTRMSFKSKYDWLRENIPCIPPENYIFTGNKSILNTDYLIDDGLHNHETFKGTSILYDAPYNRENHDYYRARNWLDIKDGFMSGEIDDFYREKEHNIVTRQLKLAIPKSKSK